MSTVIDNKHNTDKSASNNQADSFLSLIRQLVLELHPKRKNITQVKLDSLLDKDLGFDSLSRVELLLRIRRAYDISLPDQILSRAETPRDLLQAILSAQTQEQKTTWQEVQKHELVEVENIPHDVNTLIEMLEWHQEKHPNRIHVYLYGEAQEPEEISYEKLLSTAQAIAASLQQRSLSPGQTVAIMLPTSGDYLFSFFGILLAGGIPVPIYPPFRPSQFEDHMRRQAGILTNSQAVMLITVPEAKAAARLLKGQVRSLHSIITPQELTTSQDQLSPPIVRAQDIAFLQYTSGSTGNPKGVILTHAQLLANIRIMGEAVQAKSTDTFISWLPLYHDMGLIGAWFGSLYHACPLVLMSPLSFLTDPSRWLWMIHKYRGTLSAAPNFAYGLCLHKLQDKDIKGLDLSSWRFAFNGAEPVSPQTIRQFSKRFSAYGFRPEAMSPVYGLAEVGVGLAFPPLDRGPIIDSVQVETFTALGKATPADDIKTNCLEFVACGQPLSSYEIRIVDSSGRELPEREVGQLQFKGPSATTGYFRNSESTQNLFDGDWLNSGDLAYIAGGDIYLTGRTKDIIIRAGHNIYPYQTEEAIADISGIRKGCVAIIGSTDPTSGTERIIVIAETRESDTAVKETLKQKINTVVTELLTMPPDEIILGPPHTILKTSSGKIRRASMREIYGKGEISREHKAIWRQYMRLMLASLLPRIRDARKRISNLAYAIYAQLIFWLLTPVAWLLVATLPRLSWRWAVMRRCAKLLFYLCRIPIKVEGINNLPKDQICVFVANHASYLDSAVLLAALPIKCECAFVAKEELGHRFISRVFLRRIGTVFVERFDQKMGVAGAQRAVQSILSGHSLFFFPEGTFTRSPGLLPFRMGAFTTAATTNVPVVPISIHGTRSILRTDSWFPRRGIVSVVVIEPIMPQGIEWAAAVELRDISRATILRYSGEPDLE